MGNYWMNYFSVDQSSSNPKTLTQYGSPTSRIRKNHSKLNDDLNYDLSQSIPNLESEETQGPVHFIGFNSDQNCFVCGTENGFLVYNCDPYTERFQREFDGGIGIVELLGRSNILALVGGGAQPEYSPNKVIIWDDYQSKVITDLEYTTEVLAVKCRENRIIVSLYHKTFVYNFENLRLQHQYETFPNPKGICDLSLDGNVLAVLGSKMGDVRVENLASGRSHIIHAHQNDLSQITVSQDGQLMATTSKKGTLVRIWDTASGRMVKELRRGLDPVNITSLSFNSNHTSLCVASDKGTVHIYSLIPRTDLDRYQKNKKSTLSFMSGFLPTYFSSEWSYFSFSVPFFRKGKCAFSLDDPKSIIVLTEQGRYYKYRIDAKKKEAQPLNSLNFL